jgi:hypothetical protein
MTRALIADDHPLARTILRRALTRCHIDSVEAADGLPRCSETPTSESEFRRYRT